MYTCIYIFFYSNKVYKSWFNEVLATRQAEKRKTRLCRKYGLLWKRKTDMVYTAKCVVCYKKINFVLFKL